MMIGTLCLLCITFSCKKEVKTEELVLSAAKQYYDHLAGGRYQEFLAGIADADSLPPAYREQLLTNAKQFLEQQNKAHKGIKEIQTIKAVIDTPALMLPNRLVPIIRHRRFCCFVSLTASRKKLSFLGLNGMANGE